MTSRRRPQARPVARASAGRRILLVFLLLVAVGAVVAAVLRSRPPKPPVLSSSPEAKPPAPPKVAKTPKPKAPKPKPAPEPPTPKPTFDRPAAPSELSEAPKSGPRLALVIDDLGRSLVEVETLERLGVAISYAVLPFESKSSEVVKALVSRRREVLCHLPMEPEGGSNPGPGALTLEMSRADLSAATLRALEAVPGAVGVNNHMGSRLSSDRERMETVLAVIAGRGLFFLDSRTSAESVAYRTALDLGLASAERQVFLDREPEVSAIDAQFSRWLAVARERGSAIAIGHPYPSTFEVLERAIPKARAEGFEFVPVSYLLNDPGDGPL